MTARHPWPRCNSVMWKPAKLLVWVLVILGLSRRFCGAVANANVDYFGDFWQNLRDFAKIQKLVATSG
jgi:hypothetical protein